MNSNFSKFHFFLFKKRKIGTEISTRKIIIIIIVVKISILNYI